MKTDPDPSGQAALMLVESLLFLLIETKVITKEQIVEAIDSVVEVKREMAGTSESVVVSLASISLLRALSTSLPAGVVPSLVVKIWRIQLASA